MSTVSGKTGSGFVHPNMPAAIHYTANATIHASEIAAISRKARCETVQLPHHAIAVWRRALDSFKQSSSGKYADLPGDHDEQMFELPSVVPPPQSYYMQKAPKEASGGQASSGKDEEAFGIEMRSDHFVTGKKSFVYYDPTGILSSSAIVPKIINDRDEEAAEKMAMSITVEDMTEDERDAYKRLLQEWRATANSKSHAGQRLRKDGGRELDGEGEEYGNGARKKIRTESVRVVPTAGKKVDEHGNDDDDEFDAEWAALEQAERLLNAAMNGR